jgi:hypothetical protein
MGISRDSARVVLSMVERDREKLALVNESASAFDPAGYRSLSFHCTHQFINFAMIFA